MSFRIEKKYLLHNKNISKFYNFIQNNNFKKLYPDRQIFSYYMDNKNYQMHHDSEEGITPRKKIRFRWYNSLNPKSQIFFEKKINSVEGRYKTSKKINIIDFRSFLKTGFFDEQYGMCYDRIVVSYKRSYFENNKIRITLDQNIFYLKNSFSQIIYRDNENFIIEIKYQNIQLRPEILLKIPATEIRSSKYSNGINYFKNLSFL